MRYRYEGEPLTLYACHCTNCQSRTGSAFSLNLVVLSGDVVLLQGQPAATPYAGNKWWCAACGVRLWQERDRLPGVRWLAPGTLDDTRSIDPVAHIWTSEAQAWVAIPERAARYDTQPDDPAELMRDWKRARGADG